MRRACVLIIAAAAACSRGQTRGADTATAADSSRTTASKSVADPVPSGNAIPVGAGIKAPRPGGPAQAGTSSSVIEGRVDEHGADPMTFIAITPAGGTQTRISGGQLSLLGAVKGADVWARGRRDGTSFIVDTFEVRRANDRAVEDGIVAVSGTTAIVRTSRGDVRYPDAPVDLRNAVGARVWITPPVAGQAPSFAVIRLRP
jgi:hypothetical protein